MKSLRSLRAKLWAFVLPVACLTVIAIASNFVRHARIERSVTETIRLLALNAQEVRAAQDYLYFFEVALKEQVEIASGVDRSEGNDFKEAVKHAKLALTLLRQTLMSEGDLSSGMMEVQTLAELEKTFKLLSTIRVEKQRESETHPGPSSRSQRSTLRLLDRAPVLRLVQAFSTKTSEDITSETSDIGTAIQGFGVGIIFLGLLLAACLIALPLIFLNKFIRPIVALKNATDSLAKGNFETQVQVKSSDEIGVLADTFNLMVNKLKNTYQFLNDAKREADEANAAKGEFLANMSHELRTPMSGVIALTQLMLKTKLSAEQTEYLMMIKVSGEALQEVVNDILDSSKIEAGMLEIRSDIFDIRQAVSDAMMSLSVRAQQKDLELLWHVDKDIPDTIVGDPWRLRQIILNLVGNAIKFTESGEIFVSLGIEQSSDSSLLLRGKVSDTGIGISQEYVRKIFDSFVQVDNSSTRKYGGTGLGLSIVKNLSGLMGGKVWMDSTLGEGSNFYFTFTVQLDSAAEQKPDGFELRGKCALIISKSQALCKNLSEIMAEWEVHSSSACDEQSACSLLDEAEKRQKMYDYMLTDASIIDMEGHSVYEKIKHRFGQSTKQIVLLSALSPGDHTASRSEIYSNLYVLKPVDPRRLKDALLGEVNLPADVVEATCSQKPPLIENTKALRILVAEDNKVNQKVAHEILKQLGHQVHLVSNGKEAVDASLSNAFDVVLMDVQMPEMDGFQATAAIRQREQHTHNQLPIVALTSHAMVGYDQKCLAAGMNAYLCKPLQSTDVEELLFRLTSSPKSTRLPPKISTGPEYQVSSDLLFDHAAALAGLGGSDTLLRQMAKIFLEEAAEMLPLLQLSVEGHQAEKITELAHSLKGAVSLFHARQALEKLSVLEQRGENVGESEFKIVYEHAAVEVQKLSSELENYLAEKSPESQSD